MHLNVAAATGVPLGLLLLFGPGAPAQEPQPEPKSGLELMQAVYQRHRQYPYVYEEQSMVLIDRHGRRETRRLRRYSRVEEDGTVRFLLLFDSPREVKGVALLALRPPAGAMRKSVYLPAYGNTLIESSGGGSGDSFLGTDFSIENLAGEVLSEYRYVRRRDSRIQGVGYHIVDVYHPGVDTDGGSPLRRHYILKDNLYLARTDYFDDLGRLEKQQTHHDLQPVDGRMWRANMILMDNKVEQHQTLLKIQRRVFSRDYVPREMFTREWLYANRPFVAQKEQDDTAVEADAVPGTDNDGEAP